MKFRLKQKRDIEAWEPWYAWCPVKAESIDEDGSVLVWLEVVERKPIIMYDGMWYWRYRERSAAT